MVLPLYLAMTDAEMRSVPQIPPHPARLGCTFSTDGKGLQDLPDIFPQGAMLIVDVRVPFCGDPHEIAMILAEAADRLRPDSILLDFERPPTDAALNAAAAIRRLLPCPVGMPPAYGETLACPLFLPPCPLHIPLADYLRPWDGREIWLEAVLRQQTISVTSHGTDYAPPAPSKRTGGVYDEILCCQCMTEIEDGQARFHLFDTPETFQKKCAHPGITRLGGLYQDWQDPHPFHSIKKILPFRGGLDQI